MGVWPDPQLQRLPAQHGQKSLDIGIEALDAEAVQQGVEVPGGQTLPKTLDGRHDRFSGQRFGLPRPVDIRFQTGEDPILLRGVVQPASRQNHSGTSVSSSAAPAAQVLMSLRPTRPRISR